jgi:serine/threonine-protein kinase
VHVSWRVGSVVGTYRLTDYIGAGGMGEVYRGAHERTGQIAALKFCSVETPDAKLLARIYHEARVQGSLDHPNIVRLHEVLTVDDRPCLVLEYVEGQSLRNLIQLEGALSPERALAIFADVAGAIAQIHAIDVVHRDVKPDNIRITRDGVPKLLDFGIAKSRHVQGLTTTNFVIGTPAYLSPEQLRLRPATPASDIWALGIVLYEMATGRTPYVGENLKDALAQIEANRPSLPSRHMAAASERLARAVDDIVSACLVPDPARRTISASALSAQARKALAPTAARASRTRGANPLHAAYGIIYPFAARTAAFTRVAGRYWRWAAGVAAVLVAVVLLQTLPGRPGTVAAGGEQDHEITVLGGGVADVYIDGRRVGTTPYHHPVRVGDSFVVRLERKGYRSLETRIAITAQTRSSMLPLEPEGTR